MNNSCSVKQHPAFTTETRVRGETLKSTIKHRSKETHAHSNGTSAPSRKSFPAPFAMHPAYVSLCATQLLVARLTVVHVPLTPALRVHSSVVSIGVIHADFNVIRLTG